MKVPLRAVLTTVAIGASLLVGSPTGAAATPSERPAPALPGEVLQAMQRDLGLSADQVAKRTAQQASAVELDRVLREQLGEDFGGSWFDAKSGRLFVGVTDADRAAEVTAAGAEPVMVKRSEADLEAITAELDKLAGASPSRDKAASKPSPEVAGLAGWYIDPAENEVVVTALAGRMNAPATNRLSGYGDAVRVEYTSIVPTTTADFMDGGDAIGTPTRPVFPWCSAGFNLRDQSTGQGYLLSAGHCFSAGETVIGSGGVTFGPVLESFFPTFDDSITRNDNAGFWTQGPWVDTNPSAGSVITISGFSDSPVGTSVCKSGVTTRLTCGVITGKDETVLFDGVNTVTGLTRHSACVERGDSGGSNYRPVGSGGSAEGVTSGAALLDNGRCLESIGEENVSWYFPIADSLAFYGPRYNVVLW